MLVFKYKFKICGQVNKEHTIDIDLADPEGLKRTYTLDADYSKWEDNDGEEDQ